MSSTPGEFNITPQDGAAFRLSGLSFPTKFNLSSLELLMPRQALFALRYSLPPTRSL